MMIEVGSKSTIQLINCLRKLPELIKIQTTNGVCVLITEIRTENLGKFNRVLSEMRFVDGMINSETCILLSSALKSN